LPVTQHEAERRNLLTSRRRALAAIRVRLLLPFQQALVSGRDLGLVPLDDAQANRWTLTAATERDGGQRAATSRL